VRRLCQVLDIHVSGYYAWRRKPHSPRHHEDQRLLALVKPSWLESGRVYGYRKVHHDLRALGESCSRHRVARLMRKQGWRAQVGYRRRPGFYGGSVHNVASNLLDRQFDVTAPNTAWVTDITYIRTYEGWLYLAVVVDLFSRQVVGWSMDSRMSKDLVLQALLAAVWRRKPKQTVMVHSDQGSQFTSYEWAAFLAAHNLQPSMSRRGNCHDNAVAESFFQLLKRERIKRRIYSNRGLARQDIFDYIEMFYNPIRRHGYAANLSPVNYERQYFSEAKNSL
jgi:putative transposase